LCDCARGGIEAQTVARYAEHSGLTPEALRLRWGGIKPVHHDIQNATAAIRGRLVNRQGWLYLWGGPGQGKTRMLQTAVAESIASGIQAVYMTHADLLEYLRGGYSRDAKDMQSDGEYQARVEYLRGLPVLAIDEFQRARATEWAKEADARVLDDRYQHAAQGVTLFAANFAPREYSDWFASRLAQFRPGELHLQAADFRAGGAR
jgi:DNA replication protein DnaC